MQHQEPDQNFLPVYTDSEHEEVDQFFENSMPMPPFESEYVPEDSQFRELLSLLYAGKWFILASFLIILIATGIYTYSQVPLYRSHSLVLLDNRVAPDLKDALEAGPNSKGAASRSVDTEIYVLQRSLGVSRRVSARISDLKNDPVSGKPLSLLSYGLSQDALASVLHEQISITREPVEDVLRISATSTQPEEARLLADLYAEEFVGQALGRSRSRLAATRFFLENEAEERNRELKALEEEMRQFMDANSGLTLSEGMAALLSQVTELEALRDEIALEIRMREVTRADLIKEVQAMEPRLAEQVSENFPVKIERVQKDIAEIEDILNQIYRQNPGLRGSLEATQNETIVSHNSEIERLRSELESLTEAYIEQVVVFGEESAMAPATSVLEFGRVRRQLSEENVEIGRLKARLEVVNKHLTTFQAQLQGLPSQTITLTQLERSIQTTERAYLVLKEKLEDVRISEESEQGYAEIVLKAAVPFRPEFPNKPKNMMLGGLVGLLIGLVLAVLRQQFYKNTITTPEDIHKLGFSLLGVIPSMRSFVRQQFRGVQMVEHNGYLNDSCLISLQPASSFIVDAYRRLRFNIHGVHGEGAMRSLLVTSPNPAEGKSVTALNLAIASAQAGQKTVIVDADLHRPSIHTKLGINSEPGFVEMINKRRLQFRKALSKVENLYVLTAGAPEEGASEILSSRDMAQFIHELKKIFDLVIFDSPPFMLVSDPLMLSSLCDGTVIVASSGKTQREDLHQGMHEFQKIGGRVLGVLLNEFDPVMLPGGRTKYKYYRYNSHYSYQNEADAILQS